MSRRAVLLSVSLLAHSAVSTLAQENLRQWPQWRGPHGTGVAPFADPPIRWAEDQNVRWKVALPGLGHSTPVVWKDRLYLTTAIPFGPQLDPVPETAPGAHDNLPVTQRHRYVVIAVDREDGRVLWQQTARETLPHEGGHTTASQASASPATDGKHLYASFGSHGVYCYTLEGDLRWQVDLGTMQTKHAHGEGASPLLYNDLLIVNWDHEGDSFVVALDKDTGKERWRVARKEVTSWASPFVVVHDNRAQLIVSGTGRLRGYDLETGDVLWECGGLSANVVASPVAGDGLVFAGSSYDTRAMMAVRLDGARGDITGTDHVVWSRRQRTPYVPSPLLYGGGVYFLRHYQGVLTRLDAATGEEPTGPFRLPLIRDVYASPVAASGRIYITDLYGTTVVFSSDESPRALSQNRLDDSFNASPALAGRDLFLRGKRHLYRISEAP